MAKSIKDEQKIQEDITKLFQTQAQSAQKVYSILSDIAGGPLTQQSLLAEKVKEKYEGIVNLTKNLQDSIDDNIEAIKIKNKALQTGVSLEVAELQVKKQAAIAQANAVGLYREETLEILKKYNQAIKLQENLEEQVKTQKEQQEHAEKIKEYDTERLEMIEKINEKAFMLKNIFTDQRLAQAVLVKQLVSGYDSIKETFSDFRKEGLTVTQAFKETGIAMSAMFSLSGATLKENQELMAGFAKSMGDSTKFTKETVVEVGKLAKTLGIGMEEAGQLQGQLQNMAGATSESATNAMEFAGSLAKAAHIAPGAVMKDIAANSEDIALNTKNGGKDMAAVSVAAHKLGMEMSSLAKMSSGLLDFESSINKQMEASVLLGKEINLDKAREAALNGDVLGATKEMLKNVGGEAEFNKMNVVQRKALADSIGVSVQDLSKMVKNQDQLNNLTEEQQMALADGSMTMDEVLANAGGVASKLMDGGLTLVGMVGSVGGFADGLKSSVEFTKDLVGGFKSGVGFLGKMGGMFKGGAGLAGGVETPKVPEVPAKADSLGAGKGAGGGMKGLASGLKSMAGGKVTQGIGNLALFGLAAIPAVASLPFLMTVSLLGTPAGLGLTGLSEGLKGKGMGAALVSKGIANLALYGLASIVALLGLPFMVGVALTGYLAGLGMVGLSTGLKAMAKVPLQGILVLGLLGLALIPAAVAFMMLKDMPVENMIAFSIALPLLGLAAAGLGFLIVPIAAGAIALAALGVGMIAVAGGLMVLQAAEGGIAVFESLAAIAANAAGLGGVAMAMIGIAGGLGVMAYTGLAALPVIGALIALAAVAPALSGLGASLGGMFGGGGGEKEDKMDELIAEIRSLKEIASKGGVINMDGKKVGEVVRLSINSSGIK